MASTAFRLFVVGLLTLAATAFFFHDSLIYRHNPSPFGSQESGVVFFDKLRVDDGYYNLVNNGLDSLECNIMDMHGQPVFQFPKGYCHFFKDGSVVIGGSPTIQYFDATGALRWQVPAHVHHDLQVSEDENEIFFLDGTGEQFPGHEVHHDSVRALDRAGNEIFNWRFEDHLQEIVKLGVTLSGLQKTAGVDVREVSHLNSVQVLPINQLEDQHPEFKHGNVLINCFKNRLAFILDRETRKIVWSHRFETPRTLASTSNFERSGTHTVRMSPAGGLLFFANTFKLSYEPLPFSAVSEIDPLDGRMLWHFVANPVTIFFSEAWGGAFKLPNGNTLVTQTTSGSAFEVNRRGRLVWEWINPDRDPFGLAKPVYRVTRVEKDRVDRALRVWRNSR